MRARTSARVREFQVGAFILLGFFAISMFSFRLTETPIFAGGTQIVTFLDDATGLFKLAKVKQAGISIGFVKSIDLVDGRARVTLVIESPYTVPKDARVVPRPLGILGDKYIEIVVPQSSHYERYRHEDGPVPASVPEESSPAKKSSPQASRSWWSPLWDSLLPSALAEVAGQGDVLKASNSAATMDDITRQVGEVTKDLQATSKSLKKIIENNTDEVEQILSSWAHISAQAERLIKGLNSKKIEKDLNNLSHAAGNMSQSLANIESITSKLDRGEGTLGKLINDSSTIDELNRSLVTINNAFDRAHRVQSIIDLRSQYHFKSQSTKTYVGLRLMTRESSGYIGEVVMDPAGTEKTVVTTVKTNGGTPVVTETVTNDRSALKYSLQFYKRLSDVAFRLGLFESTGGLAADFFILDRRLQATVELFDLGRRQNNPNLKLWLRLPFWDYFHVEAGVNDLIDRSAKGLQHRSFFMGLGLNFNDQDIKTLFMFSGLP